MLETRIVLDFGVSCIVDYLHKCYQLSIPNSEIQNLKLFKHHVSAQKVADFGAFEISNFLIKDAQPVFKL